MTEPLDRPAASDSLVVRRQPLGRGDATAQAGDVELVVMSAYDAHHRDLLAFAGYAEKVLKAPPIGFISETAIGSDGELIVFVEDPARPMSQAASFPPDCPLPSPG